MLRIRTWRIALLLAAGLGSGSLPATAGDDATATLERSRLAYAGAGPFHEILELEITMPDGSRSGRRQAENACADHTVEINNAEAETADGAFQR